MIPPWLERWLVSAFGASWRTVVAGIAVLLTALYPPLMAHFDGKPETVPDWNPFLVAVAAFLGFAKARDNQVTSAQALRQPGLGDASRAPAPKAKRKK